MNGANDCPSLISKLLHCCNQILRHERIKTGSWFIGEQQGRVCNDLMYKNRSHLVFGTLPECRYPVAPAPTSPWASPLDLLLLKFKGTQGL